MSLSPLFLLRGFSPPDLILCNRDLRPGFAPALPQGMAGVQNHEPPDPCAAGRSLATLPVRTMLFVLIDYDESRRNAQYCAFYVLQMIELMRVRYKKITDS
jgi:hypothetical protein